LLATMHYLQHLISNILRNNGIALGYRLDDRGVQVSAEAGNFSLHHPVQTASGTHPASYPMDTRGSFPGDKAAGA
jgi:hypothetical protein